MSSSIDSFVISPARPSTYTTPSLSIATSTGEFVTRRIPIVFRYGKPALSSPYAFAIVLYDLLASRAKLSRASTPVSP